MKSPDQLKSTLALLGAVALGVVGVGLFAKIRKKPNARHQSMHDATITNQSLHL